MKKVYQTIIDKDKGNCMQAVVASLFELSLDDIPNFIDDGKNWYQSFYKFFKNHRYENQHTIWKDSHKDTNLLKRIAKYDGGINGYFYAIIDSCVFKDTTHAVIVDKNLKIVHDPNPTQEALLLSPDDVRGILINSNIVIDKTGEIYSKEI